MTSYPCNKYEQITPSYRLSVKQSCQPCRYEKGRSAWLRTFTGMQWGDNVLPLRASLPPSLPPKIEVISQSGCIIAFPGMVNHDIHYT